MIARTFILAVFSVATISTNIFAGAPMPESRKAATVVPLLQKISPDESPKIVQHEITQILGAPDMGEAGGPENNFHENDYFWLDDKTEIRVAHLKNKLEVWICLPRQKWDILYSSPEKLERKNAPVL